MVVKIDGKGLISIYYQEIYSDKSCMVPNICYYDIQEKNYYLSFRQINRFERDI